MYIIYYVYTWYLFILFLYVALWIDDHNGEKQKYSRPEKAIGGALHNIEIQYRQANHLVHMQGNSCNTIGTL